MQTAIPSTTLGNWQQILPGLRDFVKLQYYEVEASCFVYLAIVPGVPNSRQILLHVLELLTKIFIDKKK